MYDYVVNKDEVSFQTFVNMCCIKTYSKLSLILNFNGNVLLTFLSPHWLSFKSLKTYWIDFKAKRFSNDANCKIIVCVYVLLPLFIHLEHSLCLEGKMRIYFCHGNWTLIDNILTYLKWVYVSLNKERKYRMNSNLRFSSYDCIVAQDISIITY